MSLEGLRVGLEQQLADEVAKRFGSKITWGAGISNDGGAHAYSQYGVIKRRNYRQYNDFDGCMRPVEMLEWVLGRWHKYDGVESAAGHAWVRLGGEWWRPPDDLETG